MASKWLQRLVEIKILSSLKKGSFEINFIKVVNNNSLPVPVNQNEEIIDWSKLSDKQKQAFIESIPEALKSKTEILDAEYVDRVEDYKNKQTIDLKIIEYFNDKIPTEDLYALKASVYIKKVSDEGGNIRSLKQDLRNRYGQRGINISNLYSAGYFESWIKPMYENSPDQEVFMKTYSLVVEQSPFAIFVHADMPVVEIKRQVQEKINESRQYGIKICNVHGIGEDNVVKIVNSLNILKKEMNLEIDYDIKGRICVARINLSRDQKAG